MGLLFVQSCLYVRLCMSVYHFIQEFSEGFKAIYMKKTVQSYIGLAKTEPEPMGHTYEYVSGANYAIYCPQNTEEKKRLVTFQNENKV